MVVIAVAPSAPLLVKLTPPPLDTADAWFAWSHVSAYASVGAAGGREEDGMLAHSENVEVFRRGRYAEVRAEHLRLPRTVHALTARVGYLAHPNPSVLGGLTLGYRHVRGGLRTGLEVGFPLIIGTRRGSMRYEPTYTVSGRGADWNYRLQGEMPMRGTPLVAGLSFEAKSIGSRNQSAYAVSALLGVRPGRRGTR